MNIINALSLTPDQLEQLAKIKRLEQELINSIQGGLTTQELTPQLQAKPEPELVEMPAPEVPSVQRKSTTAGSKCIGLREELGTYFWGEVELRHRAFSFDSVLAKFNTFQRNTVYQEMRIWCMKGLLRWTNESSRGYNHTLTLTPLGKQYAEMYSKSVVLINRGATLTPINKLPDVNVYSDFMRIKSKGRKAS